MRFEAINYSFMTRKTIKKISSEINSDFPISFPGMCGFLQTGLTFNIHKRFRIKLLTQTGIQFYSLSNDPDYWGKIFIVLGDTNPNYFYNSNFIFIYNLNFGFEFTI